MMTKNYDESIEIIHNLNWIYIPDYPYRILIIAGSGSDKSKVIIYYRTTAGYNRRTRLGIKLFDAILAKQ